MARPIAIKTLEAPLSGSVLIGAVEFLMLHHRKVSDEIQIEKKADQKAILKLKGSDRAELSSQRIPLPDKFTENFLVKPRRQKIVAQIFRTKTPLVNLYPVHSGQCTV